MKDKFVKHIKEQTLLYQHDKLQVFCLTKLVEKEGQQV